MSRFKFLGYKFDGKNAEFLYEGQDGLVFTERVEFYEGKDYDKTALENALKFASIVLGTSYYKAHPTREVELSFLLDETQAEFFTKIYQEGLSQYAFENGLTREDLAEFKAEQGLKVEQKGEDSGASLLSENVSENVSENDKVLVLLSGGKDSLLSAEKIRESGAEFRVCYITGQQGYPKILDDFRDFGAPVIIRREIDVDNLKKAGGLNGHVPVTLINEALALVQAILFGYNRVELGVGREGLEPHAFIGDLPVNHQWSKTEQAQDLLKKYIRNYISHDVFVGSVLGNKNELEIAKEFAEKCWDKYGEMFSSCNKANYKQGANNSGLKWCGECAKCANSYLLFAPFVDCEKQLKIFGRDLFEDLRMAEIFKGLLGVDGVMKPFECIASIDELRWAYHHRLNGYGKLPFAVPE